MTFSSRAYVEHNKMLISQQVRRCSRFRPHLLVMEQVLTIFASMCTKLMGSPILLAMDWGEWYRFQTFEIPAVAILTLEYLHCFNLQEFLRRTQPTRMCCYSWALTHTRQAARRMPAAKVSLSMRRYPSKNTCPIPF